MKNLLPVEESSLDDRSLIDRATSSASFTKESVVQPVPAEDQHFRS